MQQVEAGAARAEAERRLQEKQTATLQEAVDKAVRDEFAAARADFSPSSRSSPHIREPGLLGEVLKGEEQLTRASGSGVEKALALFERGDGERDSVCSRARPLSPPRSPSGTRLERSSAQAGEPSRGRQYSRTVRSMGALLREPRA